MIENPFLTVPQIESPQSRSWEAGFLYGFQGPEQSSFAQEDVPTEDRDAFNSGVLAGQDAAINGLLLDNICVDLNVEPPSLAHFLTDAGTEAVFTGFGIAHHIKNFGALVAGFTAEGIIAVINLSIALETFSDDPTTAITERAARLQESLAKIGIGNAMELFVGGGVDTASTGCELQLTPIFRDQAAAVTAAKAIGRQHWLVVRWRSNQSGGISVADANTP
jgi:hypothetical protein